MFDRVSSQKLRDMAFELGLIGDNESDLDEKPRRFASCLSVLMRCELAQRSKREPEPDWEAPIPGFDP
jgi:hypothetical protein